MERKCSQCRSWKSSDDYSNNQWRKGDGLSRCWRCVDGYVCQVCDRQFEHPNHLKMHMQTHRPRNVACPLCGEERFRSGANAVQHVESGYCTGCRGKSNARQQIHKFVMSQRAMQPYVNSVPRLTNGGHDDDDVPEYPYRCHDCGLNYKNLSQLLQHQDNRHGKHTLYLQN
jgi:Zn-finger nucleic acid-binding protein